jgi:hypothetical protein
LEQAALVVERQVAEAVETTLSLTQLHLMVAVVEQEAKPILTV